MSNCVDQALIELIARNAILRMITDHTLQPALRGCETDCSWLGHETRVVTCSQLDERLSEVIGSDVTAFTFDTVTNILKLTTTRGAWTVDLSALEGGRPVAMTVGADGVLLLTTQDGEHVSTNLAPYVQAVIDGRLNDPAFDADIIALIRAEYNSPQFQQAVENIIDGDWIAHGISAIAAPSPDYSEDGALPTTMIGGRAAILGQPDGFMYIAGKRVPFWDAACPDCNDGAGT